MPLKKSAVFAILADALDDIGVAVGAFTVGPDFK